MRIADLLIDQDDAVLIAAHHWYVASNGYVARGNPGGRPRVLYLHRVLMGSPSGCHVDHVNGNKLDNRRSNLRVATYTQNQANRHRLNKNNSSGVRGVKWCASSKRWHAVITFERRNIFLGSFAQIEDAVATRRAAELSYFGELCPA